MTSHSSGNMFMGRDDLNRAERRWRSKPLFRREPRRHLRMALLLLLAGAGGLWLVFEPGAITSAKITLLQLLPARQ